MLSLSTTNVKANKLAITNRTTTDDSQDIFRELGGVNLLMECLSKHKELSNEAVACLAKIAKGNSKNKSCFFIVVASDFFIS